MHREHRKWWSPALGRDMDLLVYGHAGTPILAFPSSMGRFYEWEDFGMVRTLAAQLEAGHNRLVCVDSVDAEAFYNKGVPPFVRIRRYQQYEQYIIHEVVPFVNHLAGSTFVIAAGASFGGYHAANLVLKHPWKFGKLVALSGAYDIRSFMNGFYDENVYFNNPVDYLPNLHDGHLLGWLRRNHIILTAGEHDPCKEPTFTLSRLLHEKGVPHTLDFLPGAFGHDWPWWKDLIRKHVA